MYHFVEASTSGKITNSNLRRFHEHVFGENIDERALLPVDSWAGHKDSKTMKLALPSRNVDVLLIPERTTKICSASRRLFLSALSNLCRTD
jgi:hypothetical protein